LLEWPENLDIRDKPPDEYVAAIKPRFSNNAWAQMCELHALPERLHLPAVRATALLRLAVLLQRSRGIGPLPKLRLNADGKSLQLNLPKSWLEAHPLTRADLEQERDYLKQLEIRLRIGELGR